MRAPVLSLTAVVVGALIASSAAAQQAPASAPAAGPTSPGFVAAPTPEQQTAELRQQLLASQQQIARLEQALADAKLRTAALDTCRARNARLVAIGNQLIAETGRHYQRGHRDPLQLGRRRFEAELQDTAEAVYDNRYDVPATAPAATGAKVN